jgi:Tol biopolymer transport system component
MISVQNAGAGLVASLSILMVNSVAAQTIEPRKLMGTINEESSWSPDGKTIAFDSIRSGKLNIYTWRIDKRELKRITTTEANDFTPEWSPDGKQIAFVSDRTGHNEIFAVDLNGGVPRQVTKDNSDAIHPHWSPDGQRIIYCSARDNPNQRMPPKARFMKFTRLNRTGPMRNASPKTRASTLTRIIRPMDGRFYFAKCSAKKIPRCSS